MARLKTKLQGNPKLEKMFNDILADTETRSQLRGGAAQGRMAMGARPSRPQPEMARRRPRRREGSPEGRGLIPHPPFAWVPEGTRDRQRKGKNMADRSILKEMLEVGKVKEKEQDQFKSMLDTFPR